MTFIDQIISPLFILWTIGLVLSFFKRDLDYLWKACFLLIFMFYCIQFHEDLFAGYFRFKYNYAKEIVNWIYGIGKASYYFILISWPINLIRIFYSASGFLSDFTIKVQVIVTITYWILFYFYTLLQLRVDNFLLNTLVQFLRFN